MLGESAVPVVVRPCSAKTVAVARPGPNLGTECLGRTLLLDCIRNRRTLV